MELHEKLTRGLPVPYGRVPPGRGEDGRYHMSGPMLDPETGEALYHHGRLATPLPGAMVRPETFECIPQAIRAFPHWGVWKCGALDMDLLANPDDPRFKKQLLVAGGAPFSGWRGTPTQEAMEQLLSFDDAIAWANRLTCESHARGENAWYGIGFFFSRWDPFAVIDIDFKVTPQTIQSPEAWQHWVRGVVGARATAEEYCRTYTELSQGGAGFHSIYHVGYDVELVGKRVDNVERYTEGRFMIFTGAAILPYTEIAAPDDVWHYVAEKFEGARQLEKFNYAEPEELFHTDDEVVSRLLNAANSQGNAELWETQHPRTRECHYDRSTLDSQLMQRIVFHTASNAQAMRVFRMSGPGARLNWPRGTPGAKMDPDDYLRRTVNNCRAKQLGDEARHATRAVELDSWMEGAIDNTIARCEMEQFIRDYGERVDGPETSPVPIPMDFDWQGYRTRLAQRMRALSRPAPATLQAPAPVAAPHAAQPAPVVQPPQPAQQTPQAGYTGAAGPAPTQPEATPDDDAFDDGSIFDDEELDSNLGERWVAESREPVSLTIEQLYDAMHERDLTIAEWRKLVEFESPALRFESRWPRLTNGNGSSNMNSTNAFIFFRFAFEIEKLSTFKSRDLALAIAFTVASAFARRDIVTCAKNYYGTTMMQIAAFSGAGKSFIDTVLETLRRDIQIFADPFGPYAEHHKRGGSGIPLSDQDVDRVFRELFSTEVPGSTPAFNDSVTTTPVTMAIMHDAGSILRGFGTDSKLAGPLSMIGEKVCNLFDSNRYGGEFSIATTRGSKKDGAIESVKNTARGIYLDTTIDQIREMPESAYMKGTTGRFHFVAIDKLANEKFHVVDEDRGEITRTRLMFSTQIVKLFHRLVANIDMEMRQRDNVAIPQQVAPGYRLTVGAAEGEANKNFNILLHVCKFRSGETINDRIVSTLLSRGFVKPMIYGAVVMYLEVMADRHEIFGKRRAHLEYETENSVIIPTHLFQWLGVYLMRGSRMFYDKVLACGDESSKSLLAIANKMINILSEIHERYVVAREADYYLRGNKMLLSLAADHSIVSHSLLSIKFRTKSRAMSAQDANTSFKDAIADMLEQEVLVPVSQATVNTLLGATHTGRPGNYYRVDWDAFVRMKGS